MPTPFDTLLKAVLELYPFESYFCVTNSVCWHCDAHKINGELDYEVNHTPECPVTHLRNILNEQSKAAEPKRILKRGGRGSIKTPLLIKDSNQDED